MTRLKIQVMVVRSSWSSHGHEDHASKAQWPQSSWLCKKQSPHSPYYWAQVDNWPCKKKTSKSKTKQTKSKFMQVTEANYVCQEPHLPHTKPRIAVQPGLSVCIACNFSAHSGQKLQLNFGPKGLSAILALALQSAVALEILRRVCTPLAYRFLSTSLDQFRIFRNQNHGHQDLSHLRVWERRFEMIWEVISEESWEDLRSNLIGL